MLSLKFVFEYLTFVTQFQCSTTCGEGVQQRDVTCQMGNGDLVPEHLCLGATKPKAEQVCGNKMSCSDFMWKVGNWSEVNY